MKTTSTLCVAGLFSLLIATQPAQAGLLDWLGLGDSADVPDPVLPATLDQGPVRVDTTIIMGNGTELAGVQYCDFRATEKRTCRVFLDGVGETLPHPLYGFSNKVSFDLTRWPHADNMMTVDFKWMQNRNIALLDRKADAQLDALSAGNVSLELKVNASEAKDFTENTTIGKVFFKMSPDDRK